MPRLREHLLNWTAQAVMPGAAWVALILAEERGLHVPRLIAADRGRP